jgi:peptidoglycan hydrolase-like protein with peptidoglycan-binding domain
MRLMFRLVLITSLFLLPFSATADELASIIQNDLIKLGYEPGNTDGEVDMKTVVAVSKFQSEHDLEVTGELTPQLADIIKASIKQKDNPGDGVAIATGQSSEEALKDT